ncbi:MAG: hypothetical protein BGO98_31765 [Myxococcales bacterium 68-20]|nr:MAG: hypothetical protein BGO98_31765 [Myxococcales bacterium 68-20]
MKITTSKLTLVAAAAIAGVLWLGCAVSRSVAFEDCTTGSCDGGASSGPAFTEPDAGPPPEPDTPMCISYECPAPYATCLDKSGLCTTNLQTDLNNCGACGKKCAFPDEEIVRPGSFSCTNGECFLQCPALMGDCNGLLEDGCEAFLLTPANCGACGIACKEGEICWKGACGCPPGYAQCGNECKQLDRDVDNCSACGSKCEPSDVAPGAWPCGEGVLPPQFGAVCSNSSCGLGCTKGHFDCNNDMCGDGCETYVMKDPKNCGACGHACLPEQECVGGICVCEDPGHIKCPNGCIDPMSDPQNCGNCNNACPGYPGFPDGQRGFPICELGRCSFYCPPGRADCDGRIANGCEVDLMVDPLNCGGCGVHCDLENGQPCAEGRCLTKPCDVPDAGGVF